jgi:hypothetical protein
VFASIVIWGYDPFAFCELPLVCVLIGLTPARRELAPDRVARDEIVLVVLARNEHLAEWIAHHLHIGVGRIHVTACRPGIRACDRVTLQAAVSFCTTSQCPKAAASFLA